jgi:transposase
VKRSWVRGQPRSPQQERELVVDPPPLSPIGSQWAFVLDDLVTTVLLDVAIVSIIAPSAAKSSVASTHLQTGSVEAQQGHVWLWIAELAASLPNSAFEASPAAGARYSAVQRALAALATAAQYGILGLVCGGLGQAVTNALALYAAVQVDAPPPPMPSVLSVAVLWARYMASNASVRYQLVSALEGMAERSTLGSSPAALVAVSTATRLTNNVYGAVLFVDMYAGTAVQQSAGHCRRILTPPAAAGCEQTTCRPDGGTPPKAEHVQASNTSNQVSKLALLIICCAYSRPCTVRCLPTDRIGGRPARHRRAWRRAALRATFPYLKAPWLHATRLTHMMLHVVAIRGCSVSGSCQSVTGNPSPDKRGIG